MRPTGVYTAAASFPAEAVADVTAYAFDYAGATVDTVRVYLPQGHDPAVQLPLLFMVYPSPVDDWEAVSVAFADEQFAVVAISPTAARGTDAEAHAQDARVALALARAGALGDAVGDNRPVAMGGSFSSAILSRLLRAAGDDLAGWVTVGAGRRFHCGASRCGRISARALYLARARARSAQSLPAAISDVLARLQRRRAAADADHPHRGGMRFCPSTRRLHWKPRCGRPASPSKPTTSGRREPLSGHRRESD
ncbi:MAG: hypothetical protein IPM07_03525 [Anaerolineales bacterium]|nr:hypothetical protein [Anaerolineales bacterium]